MRLLGPLFASILVLALFPVAAAATDPNPASDRWVEVVLEIHQPSLTELEIDGSLTIRKFAIQGTPYESAEEIAEAYQELVKADAFAEANGQPGGRADAFVEDLRQDAQDAFRARLQETYPTAELSETTAEVDLASLERGPGDPYEPGIRVDLAARVARSFDALGAGDLTEEQVGAAFRAGAVVHSTVIMTAGIGQKVTYVIDPPASPPGLAFARVSGPGASLVDGKAVVVVDATADAVAKSADLTFALADPSVPSVDRQVAELNVTVDLQDVDISIGGAARGDMGTLVGAVEIDGALHTIALPEATKTHLGDSVTLDFLSSDGLRLLRLAGLLTDERLSAVEDQMAAEMRTRLEASLGTSVDVDLALDEASLGTAVSDPPSSEVPILFHAKASFAKRLSGAPAAQALAVYTVQQTFELPRIQGLDTTYTVILPPGLSLTALSATDAEQSTSTRPDGRESFTVTPHGGSTVATISMAVTGTFVVAKFWPVLLGALVLLVLVVGTPIALVVVRRRRPPTG